MPTTPRLSGNDAAVLGALFDPEASLQNHAKFDLQLRGPYDPPTLSQVKTAEKVALLPINTEQPTLLQLQEAIAGLDRIIELYPKYASAWNNRAQARRMLSDVDDSRTRSEHLCNVFADLARAIDLASPKTAVQMTTPDDARVLASAHTHRGYLLLNASRDDAEAAVLQGVDGLRALSKVRLEELASKEFALGGRYGNQTAQQLAIKTNPYAKLCGNIVREALQKEIKDFYGQSVST